jgi:hypothetical protein
VENRTAPPVSLSPTREAQLRLAFDDAWDARGTDALRARIAILHDVSRRLHAEQKAARGLLPNSLDDSIAILRVAARVIEVYGPVLIGSGDDAVP